MVDLLHGYAPPGVYVEDNASALVTTTGLPPTVVALVGPSVGYQTNTEQIPLTTTAVRLSKQGIDQTSLVLTRVDTGAAVTGSDYTSTPSGVLTNQNYFVDVSLSGAAVTLPGTMVFASYKYIDPNFFAPKQFNNFEDVKDAYGSPLNSVARGLGATGYQAVLSPLSLAAQIAFQNGAGLLMMCATVPPAVASTTPALKSVDLRNALVNGYAAIATNFDVDVVVPVTDGILAADVIGAMLDLRTHLESCSADSLFRTGLVGFDPGVVPDPTSAIASMRSKRLVVPYANASGMMLYNGGANQTLVIGHQYLAAAYAGRLSALPVQKSLTREVLQGFAGIAGTPLSTSVKNGYAALGIALAEIVRGGALTVRHGVTTDITDINSRELAVVRGRDTMVTLLQTGIENAGLIGNPIDLNTTLSVKSVVMGLLELAVATGTIVSYIDLAVRQRSTDPSVIEAKFAYKPSYPLNYIVVSFSIDMSTGDVTNSA